MKNSISSRLYFKFNTLASQLFLLKHSFYASYCRTNALSCFLFTTHKSASSFIPHISRIVQSRSKRLSIDYEIASWHLGNFGYGDDIHTKLYSDLNNSFNYYSRFYAPLRSPPPEYFSQLFPNNPIILFLRDPRDIAISAYYSFGGSHPLPMNSISRKFFIDRREWIKSLNIDDFCLVYLRDTIMPLFSNYSHILHSPNTMYLTYAEYVCDPHLFFRKIFNHLNCFVSEREVETLVSIANPVQSSADASRHQRSGMLDQYVNVLSHTTNSTIATLYSKLLVEYGFNPD